MSATRTVAEHLEEILYCTERSTLSTALKEAHAEALVGWTAMSEKARQSAAARTEERSKKVRGAIQFILENLDGRGHSRTELIRIVPLRALKKLEEDYPEAKNEKPCRRVVTEEVDSFFQNKVDTSGFESTSQAGYGGVMASTLSTS